MLAFDRRLAAPSLRLRLPSRRIALAALALALGGWGLRPEAAAAQRTGNFCMTDLGGSSCTANDVSVSSFAGVSFSDRCTGPGDTATGIFRIRLSSNQPDRYDLGIVIDLSGGATGAYDGDSCYHDYLTPVSVSATPPGPPFLSDFSGGGTNVCGDGGGSGASWVRDTQSLTITCADNFPVGAPDGQFDVQICNSWKVSRTAACSGVSDAVPNPGSKCNCATFNMAGPLAVSLSSFGGYDGSAGARRLAASLMLGAAAAASGLLWSRRRRAVLV